MDIVQTNNFV